MRYYHVHGTPGYNRANLWTRRQDGLYDLSGSVYAFTDDQVSVCTTYDAETGVCTCWKSDAGKHQCPQCSATVRIDNLRYDGNEQRTDCPNGHTVWRVWNGPGNPSWRPNNPARPYGWSRWTLYPELP